MDLGCGSGQSTQLFFPHFQRILAIDPSANQIAEAKSKYDSEANKHVSFSVDKAEDLEAVKDDSADMIIAGQVCVFIARN